MTHLVAGGSTGGTISGTGRYLKEQNPKIKVTLADPVGSVFGEYHDTGKVGRLRHCMIVLYLCRWARPGSGRWRVWARDRFPSAWTSG